MAELKNSEARMLLAANAEPADLKLATLLEKYAPIEIWENLHLLYPELAERKTKTSLAELIESTVRANALFVVPGDPQWPSQLEILGALSPIGLWMRGTAEVLPTTAISIVGARSSTEYGERVAAEIAAGLVASSVLVVSGGALGIDAAAHRGAIWAGGSTVALLAGGVDVPYPRANAILFDKIVEQGWIVSESPPGAPPLRHRFLIRNRLIAAWSRATVVVEARIRSGAIATASHANNLGFDVMAVPGLVTSAASAGCHQLIRDGAILVTNSSEVLQQISAIGIQPAA